MSYSTWGWEKKNHILNLYRAKDDRKIQNDCMNEINGSIFMSQTKNNLYRPVIYSIKMHKTIIWQFFGTVHKTNKKQTKIMMKI